MKNKHISIGGIPTHKEAASKKLKKDIEAFLKKGGKIKKIPVQGTGFVDKKFNRYS